MFRPLLACAVLLACSPAPTAAPTHAARPASAPLAPPAEVRLPAVAITIDDLVVGGRDLPDDRLAEMTTKLLGHLTAARAPALAFVNSAKLGEGTSREARIGLLRQWTDAGFELGNHTHSHPSLQDTPLAEYQADLLRGEPEIRELNAAKGWPLRYFRHPYLRTGPTLEVRAAFERFLTERGYTVAPVTVDNSDWLFNFVYTDARTRDDRVLMAKVGAEYLQHMADALTFHEQATERLMGRPIRHILLLHANELNAEHLDEVIALYRERGYSFITLRDALADEAYEQPDNFAGPAGVSWLYRWDFTRGKQQVDWDAEPGVSEFMQREFAAAQRAG